MTIHYPNKSVPARCAIALAVCMTITACNDNTELLDVVEDGEVGVISLKVGSDNVQLAVGQSFMLSATAVYDSGNQATFTETVEWTSQNEDIASVSNDGTVTAISPGDVAITYNWRRISGTTNIQVSSAELASIEFSTAQLEANECSEVSLTASGLYTDGTTQPLSAISEWTSNNDAIAIVQTQDSGTANLLLVDSGTTEIILTSGTVSDTVPVTVTDTLSEVRIKSELQSLETGTEQPLEVSGLFADGTETALDPIATYALTTTQPDLLSDGILLDTHPEPSTDTSAVSEPEPSGAEPVPSEIILASSSILDIVQLEDSTLVIRAKQSGTTTLTVACGGESSELSLAVIDPPELESLSFASVDIDIEPGDALIPVLTATYSDGSDEIISNDLQWEILSGDIESFELDSSTGEITANPDITIEQSIVLQANYEALSAVIEVLSNRGVREEVISAQLYYTDESGEAVPLTVAENTLSVGDTLQLTLKTVYNSGKEEFSVTDLFWSNLNPDIASIDGSGLLAAHAAGISSISAITDNIVTTFQFNVIAAPEVTETTGTTPSE